MKRNNVLVAPILSTAYRIKLPVNVNVENAFDFYSAKTEVKAVLPAVNYGLFELIPQEDNDPGPSGLNLDIHRGVDLPLAWEQMSAQN